VLNEPDTETERMAAQEERPKLTERQQGVYEFIQEKIKERGYGPTVREIGLNFKIKSPNGVMCHLVALVKKGLIKREPNMSRAISVVGKHVLKGIPLAGRIAAGQPVQMYEQSERVDFGEMFTNKNYYALEVRGQSMIEDHIKDGDYVVIKKQETARDGQTVVAVVNGQDATLKRFYREKGGKFRLEPANGAMKPIITKEVTIYGVLVGVVRKFN
jgi:repressor LexA